MREREDVRERVGGKRGKETHGGESSGIMAVFTHTNWKQRGSCILHSVVICLCALLVECVCVCVCVCWVLGEEKEDSPRLWEACADLTTCGCLVVQSVCIINC